MNQPQKLYFIGIKGVGMSALAIMAKGMGYDVTGSDVAEEFITDSSLKDAGITVHQGFSADHITSAIDLIVVGAAFGQGHPEVAAARALGLAMQTYSELQASLSEDKKTIAVAGTHGKTTTTSLLTFLLYNGGLNPSWIIGTGHVKGLPSHGGAGNGEYFVTEADDYKKAPDDPTPKFLDLTPYGAIVTSIEHDHPDMYPTLTHCVDAFAKFMHRVKKEGFLVVNGDDKNILKLKQELPKQRFITYGSNPSNDYQIHESDYGFTLTAKNKKLGPFILRLPGKHNVFNATAAIIVALQLGLDEEKIKTILPESRSVERRFEILGQVDEVVVIDDYAHHPTAVTTTLQAAKKMYPGRPLYCIFQSHTYSRTRALLHDFARAFGDADTVIITDIFASAREKSAIITAQELTEETKKHHSNVHYIPKTELLDYLQTKLPKNAIVITMGAGDIYKIGKEFISRGDLRDGNE